MAETLWKTLRLSMASGNSTSNADSSPSIRLTLAWDVIPAWNRSASSSSVATSTGRWPCSRTTCRIRSLIVRSLIQTHLIPLWRSPDGLRAYDTIVRNPVVLVPADNAAFSSGPQMASATGRHFEARLDRCPSVTNDRMMVIHVGLDLVSVAQVLATLEGPLAARYLARVYTEDEVGDCRTADGIDPQRLAARFAAKEATLKVLVEADGIPWLTSRSRACGPERQADAPWPGRRTRGRRRRRGSRRQPDPRGRLRGGRGHRRSPALRRMRRRGRVRPRRRPRRRPSPVRRIFDRLARPFARWLAGVGAPGPGLLRGGGTVGVPGKHRGTSNTCRPRPRLWSLRRATPYP